MILLVDIGNSNIYFGLAEKDKILKTFRLTSSQTKSADEYYLLLQGFLKEYIIENAIICSVVPVVTSALKKCFEKYLNIKPLIMGQGLKTGIKIKADDPKGVGSDLIADSVAGLSLYDECLIIDLGTATKFIYVKNNALEGVVIAPGVAISTKAMIQHAALLPNIELVAPKKVLNNSTIPCMQSGVVYGFASMIDGMIIRIKDELKIENLKIVSTGGLAKLIIPSCKEEIVLDDDLILKGLLQIYNKNI